VIFIRSLMRHLVELMLEGILSAYESLVNEAPSKSLTPAAASLALSQNRSVQLLFDIKFLTNLLLHKDESQVRHIFIIRFLSSHHPPSHHHYPFSLSRLPGDIICDHAVMTLHYPREYVAMLCKYCWISYLSDCN